MSASPSPKKRLDLLLAERGLAATRQKARSLIMAGRVLVEGHPVDKPGTRVAATAAIALKGSDLPYVSRGGVKLEGALQALGLDPTGWTCLDVGASTGGFTDCLLQHDAARVYALDVGYGQLAWQLRQDPRVVVLERANARRLTASSLPEAVDFACVDVAFISLRLIVPALLNVLKPRARILALIKPQFEVGKGQVGKGGVVRDPARHAEVIASLKRFFDQQGLRCLGVVPSPILGPKGNREFFILLRRR
jgi:23S rRNA (cytidine1920-2'-O)/16S rRNA (cytidine1409-2'-O)-methyltransferase